MDLHLQPVTSGCNYSIILNPLEIRTVIECLFGYLSLRDLKEYRTVNKIWNAVSEPLLRKRCKIVFGYEKFGEDGELIPRTPEDFLEDFSGSQTAVQFQSFSFQGKLSYPLLEVSEFFEMNKNIITELSIDKMALVNDGGTRVENFNMDVWVKDLPITSITMSPQTPIYYVHGIYGRVHIPSKLILPLYHLNHINNLSVSGCQVAIQDGIRISPQNLNLADVMVLKNGNCLRKCCVNDFIKFDENTCVHLHSAGTNGFDENPTDILLDFGEDFVAKEIVLSQPSRIKNWRISRCFINTLEIAGSIAPIVKKTAMKVKKLRIVDTSVDLVALPKDLERLELRANGSKPILCSEPIIFPKLISFEVTFALSAALAHFKHCYNLVEVTLHGWNETTPFQLNLLPKSVKYLKIYSSLLLEGQLDVDKLVIIGNSLTDASRILNHIKTKILGLFSRLIGANVQSESFIAFLNNLEGIILYIGKIPSFTQLNISDCVEQESEYYVFENQKGKVINLQEMSEIYGGK